MQLQKYLSGYIPNIEPFVHEEEKYFMIYMQNYRSVVKQICAQLSTTKQINVEHYEENVEGKCLQEDVITNKGKKQKIIE